ncbi:MAG: hypothetical protein KAI66_26785, partial [Lentisphaeria bacterium]|nr:hypothetical protein [Lentisphaeria bacterium]
SAYRGKPFWAWNGKLDPRELRRQLRVLKEMGLGGAFMHARVGLDTPYLSDEWFDCIRACIDECKTLGMEAWLYDEDRWPSGAGGGLVTRNPKYRMQRLMMDQYPHGDEFSWRNTTLAAFTARVDGSIASEIKRLKHGEKIRHLTDDLTVLAFREEPMPCSSWYNGYTYLDTMDREAVAEFIRVTHEAYRRECGNDFGRTVPGIFTDEPNYSHNFEDHAHLDVSVPWTRRFRTTFRERYGYDIVNHLPEVFFDVDGVAFSKARYQFYDCATYLFVDAFSRQVGEWCEEHGLTHTGHVLAEDTLSRQRGAVGSAMRFYEYMQAPGMDLLTEKRSIYDTAKQVSSVARQFDRKWRLTETYGCTGWDFSLAGHKALGDWQVALGINLRCQHLSWYTMAGEAKRDYPASFSSHSPWWSAYHKVEDYFARILAVMTRGREVRDLLVIHPIESAWAISATREAEYDGMLINLRDTLLKANIDFDYGDEDIMSRHTRVHCGPESPQLIVGKARYTTVLVPPLLTIRSTTLDLLSRFVKAGGRVLFAGEAPHFVDGERSNRAEEFASGCDTVSAKGQRLAGALVGCRRVSIADPSGKQIDATLYLLREDRDNAYLFLCNTGHDAAQLRAPQRGDSGDDFIRDRKATWSDVYVTGLKGFDGHPIELDPDTGKHFAAHAERVREGWRIRTSLPALGSRLFVVPRRKERCLPAQRPDMKPVSSRTLAGDWDYALTEPNVLLLDWPTFRIGKGRWQRKRHVLLADFAIRDRLGIPRRGGAMVQPWARDKSGDPDRTPVALRYAFDVRQRPARELFLAMEQPLRWTITLNSKPVIAEMDSGWWVDPSCRKLPLSPAMLVEGENVLEMSCVYSADGPDLEHIYLLGDFGVKIKAHKPCMVDLPRKLRCGDWVGQGLAFYSGSVVYRRKVRELKLRKGQRLMLQTPDCKGSMVRIWAGTSEAGLMAWAPYEIDVTDFIKHGLLDLGIEVISHRRNSHGPLQLKNRWPESHAPGTFVEGHAVAPRYYTVPCGLMKPPRLVVKSASS